MEVFIITSDRDFLEKTLVNEQETVRDYQRFAKSTNDKSLKKMFFDFAEAEGKQASQIKDVLDKMPND